MVSKGGNVMPSGGKGGKVEKVELSRKSKGGETEFAKLQMKMSDGLSVSQKASLGCVLGAFIGDSLG